MRSGGAPARIDAPKFHLRFERGRGVVHLGRPIATSFGRVERLAMELAIDGAVQLSGGAARFRHHRSRLTDVRLVLRPHALERAAADLGVQLVIDGHDAGSARVTFRDAVGALSWRCALAIDGTDLVIAPLGASFVRRGPVAPWPRLGRLATRLGLTWSAELGAFRWRRPLRRLLSETLLPHGWRVPDERGLVLRWGDGESLVLEQGDPDLATFEKLRDAAEKRVTALEARSHAWCDPAALAPGSSGDFERALDSGRRVEARAKADGIVAPWIRAEALERTAERFVDELDDHALADLLLAALAEQPNDVGVWRRWVESLADRGSPVALRLARAALGGPLPRSTRASLAAFAVHGALDRGDPEALDAVDGLASELVDEAERLAPELAEVIAARAALAHRHGDLAAAARAWERAADEASSVERAAQWRRRAAQLVLGLRGPRAAEPLLRRALVDLEASGHVVPTLVAQLATVMAERGERRESRELFGRLLRDPRPDDDAWRAAVLAAVRFHVEAGAQDLARPFLAALGGEVGHDDTSLESELELALGETMSSSDFPIVDLASESIGFEVFEGADEEEEEERRPRTQIAAARSIDDAPQVTLVAVADEEVRALLRDAREAEEPTGLLEGALERSLEDADPAGVRRVLRVLDRLDPFRGEQQLRERALRLLRRLGEDLDE